MRHKNKTSNIKFRSPHRYNCPDCNSAILVDLWTMLVSKAGTATTTPAFHSQVIVVGAGVVGLAITRALAKAGKEVLLLEKESHICTETSSRNSEVIHAVSLFLLLVSCGWLGQSSIARCKKQCEF